jgi:hypothetical protein
VRALWLGRDLGTSEAARIGPELLNTGTTPEALEEGQRAFQSGKRIDWRLR